MAANNGEQKPLDYESAKGMEKEAAAFFYRGPAEEVAEGVVFFPAQGNCTAFVCDGAIFMTDTNPQWYAQRTVQVLREQFSKAPVEAIAYTHGHIDHVTGAETFIADASERGFARPRIVGHRDIRHRFDRYRQMPEHNNFINRVQFNLPAEINAWHTVPWTYPDIESRAPPTVSSGAAPLGSHTPHSPTGPPHAREEPARCQRPVHYAPPPPRSALQRAAWARMASASPSAPISSKAASAKAATSIASACRSGTPRERR